MWVGFHLVHFAVRRSKKMFLAKLWSFLSVVSLCALSQNPQKCEDAQTTCQYYTMCALELSRMFKLCEKSLAYNVYHHKVTGPMADSCSLSCVYAIGNLTSLKRGKALETCECGTDAMCLTVKSRMRKCVEMASGRYNRTSIQGCTEARKRCSNDEKCWKLQTDFLGKCNDLINGINCTDMCKDVRDTFLNSELGKAMNKCECDGYEEPHCRGIRAHHKVLCVNDPRRSITDQPTGNTCTKQLPVRMSNGQSKMTLISWFIVCSSTIIAVTANFYR